MTASWSWREKREQIVPTAPIEFQNLQSLYLHIGLGYNSPKTIRIFNWRGVTVILLLIFPSFSSTFSSYMLPSFQCITLVLPRFSDLQNEKNAIFRTSHCRTCRTPEIHCLYFAIAAATQISTQTLYRQKPENLRYIYAADSVGL